MHLGLSTSLCCGFTVTAHSNRGFGLLVTRSFSAKLFVLCCSLFKAKYWATCSLTFSVNPRFMKTRLWVPFFCTTTTTTFWSLWRSKCASLWSPSWRYAQFSSSLWCIECVYLQACLFVISSILETAWKRFWNLCPIYRCCSTWGGGDKSIRDTLGCREAFHLGRIEDVALESNLE